MMPMPAAINRKGQTCVSAQRFAEGIFPALTSSQMVPAAMSTNGPNIDLLFSMISFFSFMFIVGATRQARARCFDHLEGSPLLSKFNLQVAVNRMRCLL